MSTITHSQTITDGPSASIAKKLTECFVTRASRTNSVNTFGMRRLGTERA